MELRASRGWLVAGGIALVLGASAVVVATTRGSTSSGCGPVDAPIAQSARSTPYESRRSQLPDPLLNPDGDALPTTRFDGRIDSLHGVPLRWASVADDGAVYLYFLDEEIGPRLTLSGFSAAGGIELDRDPGGADEPLAAHLLETQPGRSVPVTLGTYRAALVWADPDVNGIRPHHLYWSDGTWNFALTAVSEPEQIVSLGRELACGTPARS
jgi:hypothetical protein